jgi:DNA (cytosine-5)-methyltransferase 1
MGLVVDLFAGGGGASVGLEAALGRPVDIAINHSPTAIAVHTANHPHTEHYTTDIWDVDPLEAIRGRPVDVLWASPDCTHFSVAKGGKPKKQKIRSLAWVVIRWASIPERQRPKAIFLENVPEFRGWGPLDRHGYPVKEKAGQTFRAWCRKLERLGYRVEHRVLDASLYGAPTRRRRLFLVARRDGKPIVWPEPTHGPGRKKLRTAAECIDWSIPCPSIFDRKRPLADKTHWRIAQGIKRFVLETADPFIVKVNHGDDQRTGSRVHAIDAPLTTVTASRRGHALVTPTLVQVGYGERKGQRARVPGLEQPLGTVVAGGRKHALVAAFLARHFGEREGGFVGGRPLDGPMSTVTAKDHHSLAAATLVKLRGMNHGSQLELPMPTVTAGGTHLAEVRAFLVKYYGTATAQPVDQPLGTLLSKDRFGLVTIEGAEYAIVDIGMRMLEPHELLAAQFGRYAEGYDLSPATTKAAKVRLIGNSVCPEAAEAVIRANQPAPALRRAA